jgi:hypothetical protein
VIETRTYVRGELRKSHHTKRKVRTLQPNSGANSRNAVHAAGFYLLDHQRVPRIDWRYLSGEALL